MATTSMQPTLSLPGRVLLQRGALARRLAGGASPADSPELARRANQLRSVRSRRAIAEGLERVVHAAEEPSNPYSSEVAVGRAAITRESDGLLGLAAVLRDTSREVNVRGIALAHRMLTDGGSPLYTESDEETLDGAIRRARAALLPA